MEIDPHVQQRELLQRLFESQNWEQLARHSRVFLGRFPEDLKAHYFLAVASMRLRRTAELGNSTRILLEKRASWGGSHEAAAHYWSTVGRNDHSYWHARKMIEVAPNLAEGYALAGTALCRLNQPDAGLRLLRQARSMKPDDISIANSESGMRWAFSKSGASRAQQQLDLQQQLAAAPETHLSHKFLALIHASGFRDRKNAIQHCRRALEIDPNDQQCQSLLRDLVPVQSVFVWVFFLPIFLYRRVFGNSQKFQNLRFWLMAPITLPVLAVMVGWILATGILFFVPLIFYMTILFRKLENPEPFFSAAPERSASQRSSDVAVFFTIAGTWLIGWTIVAGFFGIQPARTVSVIASIYGVHLFALLFWIGAHRLQRIVDARSLKFSPKQRLRRMKSWIVAFNFCAIATITLALPADAWLAFSFVLSQVDLILLWSWLQVRKEVASEDFDKPISLPDPGLQPPLPPFVEVS